MNLSLANPLRNDDLGDLRSTKRQVIESRRKHARTKARRSRSQVTIPLRNQKLAPEQVRIIRIHIRTHASARGVISDAQIHS